MGAVSAAGACGQRMLFACWAHVGWEMTAEVLVRARCAKCARPTVAR